MVFGPWRPFGSYSETVKNQVGTRRNTTPYRTLYSAPDIQNQPCVLLCEDGSLRQLSVKVPVCRLSEVPEVLVSQGTPSVHPVLSTNRVSVLTRVWRLLLS